MGKAGKNTTYEEIRLSRIQENQRKLATLGVQETLSELKSMASEKTHVRKYQKIDYSSNPLRRSSRVRGTCCYSEKALKYLSISPYTPAVKGSTISCKTAPSQSRMGKPETNNTYEEIRQARIEENKRRLASLGVQRTLSELKSLASPSKSEKTHVRKLQKVDYISTPLRRSSRVRGTCCCSEKEVKPLPLCPSTPTIKEKGLREKLSPEALSLRCTSKGRGSLYDPTYGICCHFCRQKKLCGEEDCKHCGDLDLDQPCIGKTDCSICHSSTGIMCRACLSVRYGEELEDVRANKQWACPHCIEEEGTRPYWICNSSLCLKKRKMAPTGIAIYTAREMGYKSVAHLLMDKLKKVDE